MSALASRIKLRNGISMPQIHLGLYETLGNTTENAVQWALEAGYVGFDSAQMYDNERDTGKAILKYLASAENTTQLKREDIWFTSKLASNTSYTAARKAIKTSVETSGLGYIDLFLLHSPYGGKDKRLDCWKAIEDAIADGEVKVGGVSNFGVKHVSQPHLPSLSSYLLTNQTHQPSTKSSHTHSHTAKRTPHLQPQDPTRSQPNRSPPLQPAKRNHRFLPSKLHHSTSLRTIGPSSTHDPSKYRFPLTKILLHAGTIDDQMELSTWIRAPAEKRHAIPDH